MMDGAPRYTTHVRKRYGDRVDLLTEAARAVERTLESPGWSLIEELVSAELADLDGRTTFHPDRVLDQAVYAARIGYRTGLQAMRDAAQELCRYSAEQERRFEETKRSPARGMTGAAHGR